MGQFTTQKTLSTLSELRNFQMLLDFKLTFGENLLSDPNQFVFVRELFLHPPRETCFTREELLIRKNKYTCKMLRNSTMEASKLSIFLIVTAAGNFLPPMFLARAEQYDARWFYPLPEHMYTINGYRHPYTHQDWFKTGSAVHTTDKLTLDTRAVNQLFKHISYNLRRHPNRPLINKGDGVLLVLPQDFTGEKVYTSDIGENYNFEVAHLPDIKDITIDPFDYGISRCFCDNFKQSIRDLDIYSGGTRGTIRDKLILGQLSHELLPMPVALRGFQDSGMWPIRFSNDDYSFRFNFADEDNLQERLKDCNQTI